MTPSHAAVKRGGALCTVHRGSQPLGGRGASRKQSGGLEVGRDSPVFHCMHMGLFNRAEELPIVPRASQPLGLAPRSPRPLAARKSPESMLLHQREKFACLPRSEQREEDRLWWCRAEGRPGCWAAGRGEPHRIYSCPTEPHLNLQCK